MSTNASCKPLRKLGAPAASTCRWQPTAQCPDLVGQTISRRTCSYPDPWRAGQSGGQEVLGGGGDESGGVAGPGSVGAGGGGSCGVEYGSVASLGPGVVGPEGPGGGGGGGGVAAVSVEIGRANV